MNVTPPRFIPGTVIIGSEWPLLGVVAIRDSETNLVYAFASLSPETDVQFIEDIAGHLNAGETPIQLFTPILGPAAGSFEPFGDENDDEAADL